MLETESITDKKKKKKLSETCRAAGKKYDFLPNNALKQYILISNKVELCYTN